MSGGDFELGSRVFCDWPIREVMVAVLIRTKRSTLETYRFDTLVWALGATKKKKPPDLPAILRGDGDS